jgi:hypothetical protein
MECKWPRWRWVILDCWAIQMACSGVNDDFVNVLNLDEEMVSTEVTSDEG